MATVSNDGVSVCSSNPSETTAQAAALFSSLGSV